jgi:hypothetical protein
VGTLSNNDWQPFGLPAHNGFLQYAGWQGDEKLICGEKIVRKLQ